MVVFKGGPEMPAPTRTRAEHCDRRAGPTKSAPGAAQSTSPREAGRREIVSATLHELNERLTAATNYLAASLRFTATESIRPVVPSDRSEILEKALDQINRANEEARQLRKVLSDGGIKAGPVYRVCFLNECAGFNSVVRACQRAIIIRSAQSRERAIEAAKMRFCRLEGICDWRDHAKIIEVSVTEDDPFLRVSCR